MAGFSVDPASLNTASQKFALVVPTVALDVQYVSAALGVTTGNPALDALIARLAGQVAGSLAGAGKALQAEGVRGEVKAQIYAAIRTTVAVTSGFTDERFPPGTYGTVVEHYAEPEEGYAVDLAIPAGQPGAGYRYDNVILRPDEFEVVERIPPPP
jgi:hypothetical protein